jgi:hypothetical protein
MDQGVLHAVSEKANEIFDKTKERFRYVQENAAIITSDMPEKPTVLWGYYSSFCSG